MYYIVLCEVGAYISRPVKIAEKSCSNYRRLYRKDFFFSIALISIGIVKSQNFLGNSVSCDNAVCFEGRVVRGWSTFGGATREV